MSKKLTFDDIQTFYTQIHGKNLHSHVERLSRTGYILLLTLIKGLLILNELV